MLYSDPKTLLQQKLNQALDKGEESLISDLVKLSLLKKSEKSIDDLVFTEIYNLLGLENFTNLISLLDGKTITFPKKDEFKEMVLVALTYYYRNLEGKKWDDIKAILGLNEEECNTLKLGINSAQFEKFLQKIIKRNS
jgi:hypothetical protein